MADIYPAGPVFRVLPAQTGTVAAYVTTSDENPSGAFAFQLVPSIDFDGGFVVVGRTPRISTADTTVPWQPIPYRRVTLDNVASDYAIVSAVIGMAGPSQILVPANGMSVGLLIACNAGQCMIYQQHMAGCVTI